MDKKRVVHYLLNNINYTKEQKQVLEAIEEARQELKSAREFFDAVTEPKLIDYAIYLEEAAKARYAYLLSEAKKLGVKLDCGVMLTNENVG